LSRSRWGLRALFKHSAAWLVTFDANRKFHTHRVAMTIDILRLETRMLLKQWSDTMQWKINFISGISQHHECVPPHATGKEAEKG
jgi:hypothetical protein